MGALVHVKAVAVGELLGLVEAELLGLGKADLKAGVGFELD